jgi:hypothetical protein
MQSEARNAKNAPECAICGVLPYRPAPTGCVLWLVPISNPRSAREHLQAPLPLAAPGLGPVLRFQLSAFSISAFGFALLHAGDNPERANAAQAPVPLGANLRFARPAHSRSRP